MNNFVRQQFWCIKNINIFRDLSDADALALAQITTYKTLKHEERIQEEGVYLIKEGRIKISENPKETDPKNNNTISNNSDTEKNETPKPTTKEVLEVGEIIGAAPKDEDLWKDNMEPQSFVETLTEVCIGIVSIRDFSFFLKRKPHLALPTQRKMYKNIFNIVHTYTNPSFVAYRKLEDRHNILKQAAAQDYRLKNALTNIAFRCASSQIALLIQNLANTPDKNGRVYASRLSTKRISKLTGCSTETTQSILIALKEHHIIKLRRGNIQILNLWKLKKTADSRMKTLTAPDVSTTSTDDFDLQALTGFQNDYNSQSNPAEPSSSLHTNNTTTGLK